jgi:hypothetical protein
MNCCFYSANRMARLQVAIISLFARIGLADVGITARARLLERTMVARTLSRSDRGRRTALTVVHFVCRCPPVLCLSVALTLLVGGTVFAQDVENGRRLSERVCSECHAIGPSPRKSRGLPSFASIAAKENVTFDMIVSFLLLPHATMSTPPLTRKDAQDIAAFIIAMKK